LVRKSHPTDIVHRIIAHRGYAGRYPENTLPAIESALAEGVCNIELDLQLTADHIPILFHDRNLGRIMGRSGRVGYISATEFLASEAAYEVRFGEKFRGNPPTSLEQALKTISLCPQVTLFLEIKPVTLEQFGIERTVEIVLTAVERFTNPIVLLSFNKDAVQAIRKQSEYRIGWVLDRFDDKHRKLAHELQPDFLFCKKERIHKAMWPGVWQWVIYDVASLDSAFHWLARGAHYVESMWPGELMATISSGEEPV